MATDNIFDEELARSLVAKFTKHAYGTGSNLRHELDLMPLHLVMICSEYEEWTHTVVAVEKLTTVTKVSELFDLLRAATPRQAPLAEGTLGRSRSPKATDQIT